MKRLGSALSGVHPIVGGWTYQHYTGGQAINRYSSKGAVQLSVPFPTLEGTYMLTKGRITISLKGQPPAEAAIQVSGPKMTMTEGGTKHTFTKFEF